MTEEYVTITKREYESLKEDEHWARCLENAGVDNWAGYIYALEEFMEWQDAQSS